MCGTACVLQTKVNGEKDVDDIRTLMEEIDMRIKETKQQTYEFKRDVILGKQGVGAHA
jgi:predicted phage-related endonuclease